MIDGQFLQSAIGGNIGPQGEVWFAPSLVDGTAYGALFVADLKMEWTLRPQDVGYDKHAELLIFESNTTAKVVKWSQDAPLVLQVSSDCVGFILSLLLFAYVNPSFTSFWYAFVIFLRVYINSLFIYYFVCNSSQPCGLSDFALWTIIPTASNKDGSSKHEAAWTFLGETDKWVSISATRFERITSQAHDNHDGSGVSVLAVGTAGEVLNVAFSSPSLEVKRVQCVVGASGRVTITSAGKCETATA